jgi:hypothetical protein
MKKYFTLLLFFILLVSCKEDFDAFGDLKTQYALTCMINYDDTYQIASLTKTYLVDNYNSYSNETDPNIRGALIRVWNGDSVAVFNRDTTLERTSGSQYKTPYYLYYTKKFAPDASSSKLEIEAILPNGILLSSSAILPSAISFSYNDKKVPPTGKTHVDFTWNPGEIDNAYLTKVSIYYYKADDPKKTLIAYVPLKYIEENGTLYPVDPQPTNSNTISVDIETISKTMELISKDDSNKSNYVILGPYLEVVSFNKSMSTYFNSISRTNDTYTVNLNEVDYSNITNGLGIFGVYRNAYKSFDFTHAYIKSFGYTPGLTDVE